MTNRMNGLDLLDVLGLIKRKQRRYIALLLNDVEEIMADDPKYTYVRKILLDYFNDYTRSIFRILIGDDIEGLTYR